VHYWLRTWTHLTGNPMQSERKPIMTPACPIGDPGLITRRSQVQILPPQFGLPQTSAIVSSRRYALAVGTSRTVLKLAARTSLAPAGSDSRVDTRSSK
jgi:hypothetical protein